MCNDADLGTRWMSLEKEQICSCQKGELAYNLVSVGITVHFDDVNLEWGWRSFCHWVLNKEAWSLSGRLWIWLKARTVLAPLVWTLERTEHEEGCEDRATWLWYVWINQSLHCSVRTQTSIPLELSQKSIEGVDLYCWMTRHPLKMKDEVFEHFKEWQAEVENFIGRKVKVVVSSFPTSLQGADNIQHPRAEWCSSTICWWKQWEQCSWMPTCLKSSVSTAAYLRLSSGRKHTPWYW